MENITPALAANAGATPDADYWNSLLDTEQAARFCGLSHRTLAAYRGTGDGPHYHRLTARCIRYRRADLREWIESRTARSTAEYAA